MDTSPRIRDRTAEFRALRHTGAGYGHLNSEEQLGSEERTSNGWPPIWVRSLSSFSELETVILTKIANITALQQQTLRTHFRSMEDEEERSPKLIEKTSEETNKLLKELDRLVHVGMVPKDSTNMEELLIVSNAKKHLSTRLMQLIQTFTNIQELYRNHLKEREKQVKKYARIGSEEAHEIVDREVRIAHFMKRGFSDNDIEGLLLEEARCDKINDEIKETASRIGELNSVFQHLNSLVIEQGSALDRVDLNLNAACIAASRGFKELEKAKGQQGGCSSM